MCLLKNRILVQCGFALFLCLFSFPILAAVKTTINQVKMLEIDGPIEEDVNEYITSNFQQVKLNKDIDLIIIKVNSSGTSVPYARMVAEEILASPIPVLVYVPSKAKVSNFGILLIYASNIAAMAPDTQLDPPMADIIERDKTSTDLAVELGMVVYIVKLAQLRDRNSKLATELVMNDIDGITATTALKANVINIIADDVPSLLKKINNSTIRFKGEQVLLNTENTIVNNGFKPVSSMDVVDKFVTPTIAYLIFMIGVYCLVLAVLNFGFIFPITLGSMSAIFSLYALCHLPISLMGAALVLSGILLLVLDLMSSVFMIFAILGLISFFFGSMWLYETLPNLTIQPISMNIVIMISTATFFFFSVFVRLRVRSKQRFKLFDEVIYPSGAGGEVIKSKVNKGIARFGGEDWRVISPSTKLTVGGIVYPVKRRGLTIIVTVQNK